MTDTAAAPSTLGLRRPTVADVMLKGPAWCDPQATVGDLRRFFADDHVHAALIVQNQSLLAVVDRNDLTSLSSTVADEPAQADARLALTHGTLAGRVVRDTTDLDTAHRLMVATGRRRLAVIDVHGRCLGLLCLKRSGTGFCSDDDVARRRLGQERWPAART